LNNLHFDVFTTYYFFKIRNYTKQRVHCNALFSKKVQIVITLKVIYNDKIYILTAKSHSPK